jgi:hypothetical protein
VKPFAGSTEAVAYKVCYDPADVSSQVDIERAPSARGRRARDRKEAASASRTRTSSVPPARRVRGAGGPISEETIITEIVPTTIRIEPTSLSHASNARIRRNRAPTRARLPERG